MQINRNKTFSPIINFIPDIIILLICLAVFHYSNFLMALLVYLILSHLQTYYFVDRHDKELESLKQVIAVHQRVLKMQTDLNAKLEHDIAGLERFVDGCGSPNPKSDVPG